MAMFDDTGSQTMQRVRGRAAVGFAARADGSCRLSRLDQAGSAKAFLPSTHRAVPEVVFLNTAGGLTSGDRLEYRMTVPQGGVVTATTQTAERAYDAGGGPSAEVSVGAEVAAGGRLDWLPQETILYDGAALTRRTEIALSGDATCLLAETLVLGRAAMGETVGRLALFDSRRVLRDGIPVFADPVRLGPDVLSDDGPALLGGARALATVALVGPGAEDAAHGLRALTAPEGVRWAVSGWNGRTLIRAVAGDGFEMRRAVAQWLQHLRGGPLPRVWQG